MRILAHQESLQPTRSDPLPAAPLTRRGAIREQYFPYLLYLGLLKGYSIDGVYQGNQQHGFTGIITLLEGPV